MPFIAIHGSFVPSAGIPDGDSVRFRADDNSLWQRLEGTPVELGTGAKTLGTVQLRLEGIDAIEKAAQQPLATTAKQSLFDLLGFDPDDRPSPAGCVLTRMTDDRTRRPIAFAFAGSAPWRDGAEVHLSATLLKKSVNWRQMRAGHAYPLYYNTLFAELRRGFDQALAAARADGLGVWPSDRSRRGVTVTGPGSLATMAPVWPKLWRRLQEYLRLGRPMSGFVPFLAAKNERLDRLDVMEELGLQDVVKVVGKRVMLTQPPENLRIRGRAGRRA